MIEAFAAENIDYMVVGSLSASAYGITRSTKDADFVIELGKMSFSSVMQRLGPEFQLDPQMSFETNTGTMRQVIRLASGPDRSFSLERRSARSGAVRRRRTEFVPQIGRDVFVPTAEDVIITKLRWVHTAGRPKDREDIGEVLAVQRGKLDLDYIHRWCDEHGTRAILDEIRATVPEI
jgi:hypothetical protein